MIEAEFITKWVPDPDPQLAGVMKPELGNSTAPGIRGVYDSSGGVGDANPNLLTVIIKADDQTVIDAIELAGYSLLWSQTI